MGFLDGLFGGGSSSGPKVPDIDYETPKSFKGFMEYTDQNRFEDGPVAADYADNIYDAMHRGSIDRNMGLSLLSSRLAGNSSFYGSDRFQSFLDYELPNEDQDQIIQGAAQNVFFRDLDSRDLSAYKVLAQSMGKTGSTADLSNFIQTRMAGTLEGQNKYKDDNIRAYEAYYGRALRDDEGNLTGTYATFGLGEEGAKKAKEKKKVLEGATEFSKNYLKKLGAK